MEGTLTCWIFPTRESEGARDSIQSGQSRSPRRRRRSSRSERNASSSSEDRQRQSSESGYHKGKGTDRCHDCAGPSNFDPESLVKSREGTFKPPNPMERYLKKHLRRCLSKEEREALFKEHPLPDIDACTPPKPDKYLMDHLGKRFPKDFDSRLNKVQTAVLAITRRQWCQRGRVSWRGA